MAVLPLKRGLKKNVIGTSMFNNVVCHINVVAPFINAIRKIYFIK